MYFFPLVRWQKIDLRGFLLCIGWSLNPILIKPCAFETFCPPWKDNLCIITGLSSKKVWSGWFIDPLTFLLRSQHYSQVVYIPFFPSRESLTCRTSYHPTIWHHAKCLCPHEHCPQSRSSWHKQKCKETFHQVEEASVSLPSGQQQPLPFHHLKNYIILQVLICT